MTEVGASKSNARNYSRGIVSNKEMKARRHSTAKVNLSNEILFLVRDRDSICRSLTRDNLSEEPLENTRVTDAKIHTNKRIKNLRQV